MDNFKIELFENEYKQSFPVYKALTKSECQELLGAMSKKHGIDSLNFAIGLATVQLFYGKFNATDNGFGLINILADLGINYSSDIFINWYKFERVDVLSISTLDKYFDDIWFPISDDIDLFDESLDWIISIRHDGCITYLK